MFSQTTKAAEAAIVYPLAAHMDVDTERVTAMLRDAITVSEDTTTIARGEIA